MTMSTVQALSAALARDEPAMVSLLERLVAIPSENPPGVRYADCVDALVSAMREVGLDPTVLQVPVPEGLGPRFVVEAEYGNGARVLYLHGHYDVVPADDPAQFRPERRGDALFGRGTSDMKSGLVAMLYAVKVLRETGAPLDGRVRLRFVPDEETGGAWGSGYLASCGAITGAGTASADVVGMILAEPTSGVVWHANRGALSLRVRVRGRAAHVGLQHQGVNAFEQAVAIVQTLIAHREEVAQRRTSLRLEPSGARGSILLVGGRVEAGTNFNVVPDTCSFTVDRRMNPEEDYEVEKAALLALFDDARTRGIDCEVDIFQEGAPSATDESAPLSLALCEAVREVTGSAPAFEMCPGLLELRFYAQEGIPALAYGPGVLAVSHGPNEFVKVSRITECAAVYARTALALLGTHR